ncbi:tyrosine-type recombinase/integrase [Candidatus Bipolaricaulota bacterium]|nr:tyrosine-type recombinase/integrase [Candidatus Bipolaricaulota bacterium]
MGKGAKERSVSFGAKVYKALRKWLITREELDEIYDDNIFLDRNGEKLKKRNVQRIITTIQDKADLGDEDILPHVLRHTSATLSAKNGMNVSQLKQMYGWEQLETAKKYIHLSGRGVKEAIQEASPIDRL